MLNRIYKGLAGLAERVYSRVRGRTTGEHSLEEALPETLKEKTPEPLNAGANKEEPARSEFQWTPEELHLSRVGKVGGERWMYIAGEVSVDNPKVCLGGVSVERKAGKKGDNGYEIQEQIRGSPNPPSRRVSVPNELDDEVYASQVRLVDRKAYAIALKLLNAQNLQGLEIKDPFVKERISDAEILSAAHKPQLAERV